MEETIQDIISMHKHLRDVVEKNHDRLNEIERESDSIKSFLETVMPVLLETENFTQSHELQKPKIQTSQYTISDNRVGPT